MRLFEISAQYRALESLADSEELAPEFIADTLEGLEGDFEAKAIAVAKFILGLDAEAKAIAEAAAAMELRALRIGKRAESIRAYLLLQFMAMDWKKINTSEIVIARRNNPVAVQVSDERSIPEAFWIQPEPPPKRIDKKAVKAALQSGTDVPGCYLESGESIRITL